VLAARALAARFPMFGVGDFNSFYYKAVQTLKIEIFFP
jgi:hypothetical protein